METIVFTPIGVIHSPFADIEGMPIQPSGAAAVDGTVTVFPAFREGLRDLEGFSHIMLFYHFHAARGYQLQVVPFLDTTSRGVFATRAPRRPNAIGFSIVRLRRIRDGELHVSRVDILDGTPLLDIKPYVPAFDAHPDADAGWLREAQHQSAGRRSDERFR
jgi:tRNA-Thr(GGU) m(6)t(6)A37 methyltransferase TsaA